jgi:CheY-like chemotaxis protein
MTPHIVTQPEQIPGIHARRGVFRTSLQRDDDQPSHGKVARSRSPLRSSHPVSRKEGRKTAPVIAVLDSDPSFLSLMDELLSEEGYVPLLWQAAAQPDPLALPRQVQPALVILDLWIERRDDGWELLKRLWADVETTHILAVIVTGEPDVLPVRTELLRAMHCEAVRKPFDLQELLTAIAGRSPRWAIRVSWTDAPLSSPPTDTAAWKRDAEPSLVTLLRRATADTAMRRDWPVTRRRRDTSHARSLTAAGWE